MVEASIIRQATPEERKDFIEVGRKNFKDYFRAKRIETEQQFVKLHKPFCARCATFDFQDRVRTTMEEIERKEGFANWESKELGKIDIGDLSDYGKGDRFELLKTDEAMDMKMINGNKRMSLVGHNHHYKCKKRGCGVTVFIPLEEENKK